MQVLKTSITKAYQFIVSVAITVVDRLIQLPRNIRQSLLLALDMLFVPFSVVGGIALGLGGQPFAFHYSEWVMCLFTMLVSAVVFLRLGLYRAVIRFMGHQAMMAIMQAVTVSALILAMAQVFTRSSAPPTTPFMYWCIAMLLIGGSRLIVRAYYHVKLRKYSDNVVIYGAGESGRQLLNALQHGGQFEAVFFVDDDNNLSGTVINGVSVIGPGELPRIVNEYNISQVLLAMPLIDPHRRREIINRLVGLPVYVRTIPSFTDLVHGHRPIGQIQDIAIEDLLGREPVPPHPELISKCIEGKVVVVTGAGGSIGTELCRQIIHNQPKLLILFDVSEYALYCVARELEELTASHHLSIEILQLLGSVQDFDRLNSIFTTFKVDTVYHAAAYKHVPLVEYNVVEGVRNNAIGTYKAALAAVESNVGTFVLVSTDKAVRPTNVMGASKRLAEQVLQALSNTDCRTRFCMVRFGNVLGSSGSVVPLFREQINSGGPVTVTHLEVIRFFMTVQEAAQLVLQASAMGKGGDVFVLEMGAPVKIIDLAKRMIRLAGHEVKDSQNPYGDIEIQLTGLRLGEKLYEELMLGDNVTGTGHPMIMSAEEETLSFAEIKELMTELEHACRVYDCEVVERILTSAVRGFRPENGVSDVVWDRQQEIKIKTRSAKAKVQVLYPEKEVSGT